MINEWIDLKEAGRFLGVAPNTVMVWAKDGKLHGKRKEIQDYEKGQKYHWLVKKPDIQLYLWTSRKITYQIMNTTTGEIKIVDRNPKVIVNKYIKLDPDRYIIKDTLGHVYRVSKKEGRVVSIKIKDHYLNLDVINKRYPKILINVETNEIKIRKEIIPIEKDLPTEKPNMDSDYIRDTLYHNLGITSNLYYLYLFTEKIIIN